MKNKKDLKINLGKKQKKKMFNLFTNTFRNVPTINSWVLTVAVFKIIMLLQVKFLFLSILLNMLYFLNMAHDVLGKCFFFCFLI